MGQAQGQSAVIGQQQGPAAGHIEPTYRMEAVAVAQLGRQQLQHGGESIGSGATADHPGGLVQQQHQRWRGQGQGLPIHNQLITGRIGTVAQPC
jgi:hypothetical protein